MHIYVAGPMRGHAQYNFPAFDRAAAKLHTDGHTVVNPAELDRKMGVTEDTDPFPPNFLRIAIKRDLLSICECDAIYLLRGWEKSAGVAVELAMTKFLGLEEIIEPMPSRPLGDIAIDIVEMGLHPNVRDPRLYDAWEHRRFKLTTEYRAAKEKQ